jgi:hypothetical protein
MALAISSKASVIIETAEHGPVDLDNPFHFFGNLGDLRNYPVSNIVKIWIKLFGIYPDMLV